MSYYGDYLLSYSSKPSASDSQFGEFTVEEYYQLVPTVILTLLSGLKDRKRKRLLDWLRKGGPHDWYWKVGRFKIVTEPKNAILNGNLVTLFRGVVLENINGNDFLLADVRYSPLTKVYAVAHGLTEEKAIRDLADRFGITTESDPADHISSGSWLQELEITSIGSSFYSNLHVQPILPYHPLYSPISNSIQSVAGSESFTEEIAEFCRSNNYSPPPNGADITWLPVEVLTQAGVPKIYGCQTALSLPEKYCRIFIFRNKYGRTRGIVVKHCFGNKTVQFQAGVWGDFRNGFTHLGYQSSKSELGFFNADKIQQYPFAEIVLTNSLEIADGFDCGRNTVMASWFEETQKSVNSRDLEQVYGRKITFIVREGSSFEKDCRACIDLYTRLQDKADICIQIKHANGELEGPITLKALLTAVAENGLDIPHSSDAKPSTSKKQVKCAYLKPDDKPTDEELIEGIAYSNKTYLCVGGAKVGKGILGASLSYGFSSGGCLWDHFMMCKKSTLLFDTEGDRSTNARRGLTQRIGRDFGLLMMQDISIPGSINAIKEHKKMRKALINFRFNTIEQELREGNHDVLIIDCIYSIIDANNSTEVASLIEFCIQLNKMKKTVFLVHHTNKRLLNKADPFQSIAGISELVRFAYTAIMITGSDHIIEVGGHNTRLLDVHFMSRGYPFMPEIQLYIRKDAEGFLDHVVYTDCSSKNVKAEAEQNRLKKLEQAISDHIPASEDGAINKKEVVGRLSDKVNWSKSNIDRRKVDDWLAKGLLQLDSTGKLYFQGPKIKNGIKDHDPRDIEIKD